MSIQKVVWYKWHMNPKNKLSPIERAFCEEWLLDQIPTQAAIRSGYPKSLAAKKGKELLRNPIIRQVIQMTLDKRSERTMVDADSILLDIQSVVKRCMQEEQVIDKRTGEPMMIKTKEGTLAPQYKFDASGALAGLALLGKHVRLFGDTLSVTGTVTHKVEVGETLKAIGLNAVLDMVGVEAPPKPLELKVVGSGEA